MTIGVADIMLEFLFRKGVMSLRDSILKDISPMFIPSGRFSIRVFMKNLSGEEMRRLRMSFSLKSPMGKMLEKQKNLYPDLL